MNRRRSFPLRLRPWSRLAGSGALLWLIFSPIAAEAADLEALAARLRPSLVAIYPEGRGGQEAGIGSGFVISADGLIATNLHVIGEGRALRVEFADGHTREVTGIHAWDRARDLAVLRVAGQGLPVLELGDSDAARQGTPAIAMGNPLGYRFSLAEGLISARQEVEGRPMLQLSMPVERGNSGGPVADTEGRVLGIVTLRSALTANIGFAVPVEELKTLLRQPNPVAMRNWLTIGALNPRLWQIPGEPPPVPSAAGSAAVPGGTADTAFSPAANRSGTRWSQRAGIIRAHGPGSGFGGRSQCLSIAAPPPELPFEASVEVRLEDGSGAAGLVFCHDGENAHYGFYPSNGGLRLTKFLGPEVSSWTILAQVAAPESWQPGAWNHLCVRVTDETITCWLNGSEVIAVKDASLRHGPAGLCQFRGTPADFRSFRMGPVPAGESAGSPGTDAGNRGLAVTASPALRETVRRLAAGETLSREIRETLQAEDRAARGLAEAAAANLERQAAALRLAGREAVDAATAARLAHLAGTAPHPAPDGSYSLPEAALLVARLEHPDLDPAPYLAEIGRMAGGLQGSLTPADRATPQTALAALNRWLFEENGFHGARDDFSSRSNSCLNEVIDDREGLPVTLAILQMELGRRIGLQLAGIPLPGRFVTQLRISGHPEGGPYIDVFDGGRVMDRRAAAAMVLENTGTPPQESDWEPATGHAVLLRILQNLQASAVEEGDRRRTLAYLGAQIALSPDTASHRIQRFQLLALSGRRPEAAPDFDWLLRNRPAGTSEAELLGILQRF